MIDAPAEDTKLIPRQYQRVGIHWLYTNKRGILSDQPGLGKTLQAAEASVPPTLVVAPTYLTEQWYEFLCEQYPTQKVILATGIRTKKISALRRAHREDAEWVVINTQMLRTHFDYLKKYIERYNTVIIDECHHLRNRSTSQSKCAYELFKDERLRVYMLSATPSWKTPDDVWMQLHILYPEMFKSYYEFVNLYLTSVATPWSRNKVIGIRKTRRKELDDILTLVKFGRTYTDVGRMLPPVIEKRVRITMPESVYTIYNDLKRRYRIQLEDELNENGGKKMLPLGSASAVMHSLRNVTAMGGKVDAIADVVDDISPDDSVLIFTWYRDTAHRIVDKLAERKHTNVQLITGEDQDKTERIAKAMSGRIVVATIASLSEGVNMQHVRHVIYAEEDWPPGSNYQSLSRVRRDRQDDGSDVAPVIVYYVMCNRTIDVEIHNISRRRSATIRDLMRETLN